MTSGESMAGDRPLRVLSWNLWWRFGPWQRRRRTIAAVLADLHPDVCGLQEVWSVPDENFAASLARELGMHWAWAPSPAQEWWRRRIGDPEVEIGNAVLSRWPIVKDDVLHLPASDATDEGRTALFALLNSPGGEIPFFTTQLNSAPGQSTIRVGQVRALARFVAARAIPDFPPVVTGDFNAEPDSDEMRLLCGHKTAPAVPGLVLVDAWRYADPHDPGWTWDPRNPFVRKTMEFGARIDYVLVGAPKPSGSGHVRAVRIAGNEPVNQMWPSDHAAVVATLQGVGSGE